MCVTRPRSHLLTERAARVHYLKFLKKNPQAVVVLVILGFFRSSRMSCGWVFICCFLHPPCWRATEPNSQVYPPSPLFRRSLITQILKQSIQYPWLTCSEPRHDFPLTVRNVCFDHIIKTLIVALKQEMVVYWKQAKNNPVGNIGFLLRCFFFLLPDDRIIRALLFFPL